MENQINLLHVSIQRYKINLLKYKGLSLTKKEVWEKLKDGFEEQVWLIYGKRNNFI